MTALSTLTVSDHSRYFKDCVYVYPVVSRRAQGVSLGINLNVNNACNWRCVYCQVEGLVRGKPEAIDLNKLEHELDMMIGWVIDGDFLQIYAPEALQRFNDICLSGNGEPTISRDFVAVIGVIAKLRAKYKITKQVKTLLITNGSEFQRREVQEGARVIARNNGEVWFKIDRATEAGIARVNQVSLHLPGIIEKLKISAGICPTYIQSCWFKIGGENPEDHEIEKFREFVFQVKAEIQGVLLYSTARNPALPEGADISQVDEPFLAKMAALIEAIGVKVKYYR